MEKERDKIVEKANKKWMNSNSRRILERMQLRKLQQIQGVELRPIMKEGKHGMEWGEFLEKVGDVIS